MSEGAAQSMMLHDDEGAALWKLCLYVAGMSPAACRALRNLTAICDAHLAGRYTLDVIDLLEHPQQADEEIIAVPLLVRREPQPVRKIIGDLSKTDTVLRGLEIFPLSTDATSRGPRRERE